MELSKEQIRDGFWYHKPENNFPPESISYPGDYSGDENLNIVCTQLSISEYQQKKLVKEWTNTLPTLENVRYLWFRSRVNQSLFEAACSMPSLEGLFIKWSGVKNIESLKKLNNLKYLHVGSSAQVTSINVLGNLTKLLVLEIENFKRITKLEPIGNLINLEGLGVSGDIWTTQNVESLSPLISLKNLRYLFLDNLKTPNMRLKSILHLKSLVNLKTSYWWPKSDYSLLRNNLPELKYGSVFELELIDKFGT